MSALVALIALLIWIGLGYLAWRAIARSAANRRLRSVSAVLLIVIWVIAPWGDEWLGSWRFHRLCDEMPQTLFHGPISVGEGVFFDGSGSRALWTQREIEAGQSSFSKGDTASAYAEGQRFQQAWRAEFASTTQRKLLQEWPTPVFQETRTYVHVRTNQPILVSHWLGSPGGWIKRAIGWGAHAPYECTSSGQWPLESSWIKF